MFEEYTIEKKPVLPPPPEEKPAPKPEVEKEKEEQPVREREPVETLSIKDEAPIRQVKERERYTRAPYVAPRGDYPTPSSSDMGYGTSQSDSYSTNYGSTNTTPLG